MDYVTLLQEIFQICIIPLLGVLTTYLVIFIRNKTSQLQKETDNELYKKYMNLLSETIIKCVIATNQTYVESLKDKNAFDEAAQREAFNRTYNAVISILSQDAIDFLNSAVGDLNTYSRQAIEAQVKLNKNLIIENKKQENS